MRSGPLLVFLVGMWVGALPARAESASSARSERLSSVRLIETADTFFIQGDYEGARQYYLEALPDVPQNFHVVKNLAFCYFRLGPRARTQAAHYYSLAYGINAGSADVGEKLAQCLPEEAIPLRAANLVAAWADSGILVDL